MVSKRSISTFTHQQVLREEKHQNTNHRQSTIGSVMVFFFFYKQSCLHDVFMYACAYVPWCLFVLFECSDPIYHGHVLPPLAEICFALDTRCVNELCLVQSVDKDG